VTTETDQTNLSTNGEVTDPFDLAAMREAVQAGDFQAEKVLDTIKVKRPDRTEYFRVHPSADYTIDAAIFERDGGTAKETYWVTPGMFAYLGEELRKVRLFVCVNKHGVPFLWAAKLPRDDSDAGRLWHQSALRAAETAKDLWVKMVGNRSAGYYEHFKAKGDLGEPVWPDKTLAELLKIAFQDHVVDNKDHHVIRELAGEL
jgi:hypothetical protein